MCHWLISTVAISVCTCTWWSLWLQWLKTLLAYAQICVYRYRKQTNRVVRLFLCMCLDFDLGIQWGPQEHNMMTDSLSTINDSYEREVSPDFFHGYSSGVRLMYIASHLMVIITQLTCSTHSFGHQVSIWTIASSWYSIAFWLLESETFFVQEVLVFTQSQDILMNKNIWDG